MCSLIYQNYNGFKTLYWIEAQVNTNHIASE